MSLKDGLQPLTLFLLGLHSHLGLFATNLELFLESFLLLLESFDNCVTTVVLGLDRSLSLVALTANLVNLVLQTELCEFSEDLSVLLSTTAHEVTDRFTLTTLEGLTTSILKIEQSIDLINSRDLVLESLLSCIQTIDDSLISGVSSFFLVLQGLDL